jgi:hypothetical protein
MAACAVTTGRALIPKVRHESRARRQKVGKPAAKLPRALLREQVVVSPGRIKGQVRTVREKRAPALCMRPRMRRM